ncbi:MAG: transglutaminase domain-containing protein, partial [Chitinophagaceae bacterium]
PAVKAEVLRMKTAAASRQELIENLYRYLQRNTRYVGVQLGIGGWRPFPAEYVAANGYGDCKALSNYMVALLKEAGIPSLYSLVRAGGDISDVDGSFPSANFNHVIVCVPGTSDTTWLECTSQTVAAGYLGDFTGNRHILLVTDEGGVLVRTPVYTIDQNKQDRKVNAVLSPDGTLLVKTMTSYQGLQQDDLHGMLNALTRDKVHEYLQDQLDFATYEVKQFGYDERRASLPEVSERLELEVSNYATITGKRLFINPNIMTRFYRHPAPVKQRQFPVRLGEAYTDTDTVTIELPDGYKIESMPPVTVIDNGICAYTTTTELKGNKLSYHRTLKYRGGNYPPEKFAEITGLFDKIYKADRSRIVFVKSE